ncbi:hypothetical protein B0H12DRAFT_128518 [Mycena haematopus]|nr:hypothetical protein B0H12DRAFT_128518 [Mycena haematopus]
MLPPCVVPMPPSLPLMTRCVARSLAVPPVNSCANQPLDEHAARPSRSVLCTPQVSARVLLRTNPTPPWSSSLPTLMCSV